MEEYAYIRQNVEQVRAILGRAAAAVGRKPPTLIAVTKSALDDEVLALCACGIDAIAENRARCFCARRDLLAAHGYDLPIHLIGSLQTNKVKYVARDAAMIQSLDSLRLAAEIEKQAAKLDRTVDVLIEVNSAGEAAKGGILPEDVLPIHAALTGGAYPHIAVRGLMTMGPVLAIEEGYRPYFRMVRTLFEEIASHDGFTGEPVLSMGMSDSFRVAAEEGATVVRVGRRLFHKEQ